MPAYFSIETSFKENTIYPSFVSDVYNLIFQCGFAFKSGYWFGQDMTLQQIIDWNQCLLESKFKLGFTQHVKHDYKQILLNTDMYSEMRLFWMYLNNRINLSLIIPEEDILMNEGATFAYEKVNPLLRISSELWQTGLTELIQSSLEFDGGVFTIEQIKRGQLPCINPLCILDVEIAEQFCKSQVNTHLDFKNIENNGVLIINNSLIKF